MAEQTTIDHVIIAVANLAQATADYSLLLGRHPSWQGSHPDHGTENTLFKLDNIYIELLACLLYTSPSPRDGLLSRMPSSA